MGSLIDQSCLLIFLVFLAAQIVIESLVITRVTSGAFTVTFGEVGSQAVHQGKGSSRLLQSLLELLLLLLNFLYRIAFLYPFPNRFLRLQVIDSFLLIKLDPLNFVFEFGPDVAIHAFGVLLENDPIMDHLFLRVAGFAQFARDVLGIEQADFVFFFAVELVTVVQFLQLQTHLAFHVKHLPSQLSFIALVVLVLKFDSRHCIFQPLPFIITLLVLIVFHVVLGDVFVLQNLVKVNSFFVFEAPVEKLFFECVDLVFDGGTRLTDLFVVDDFDGRDCLLKHFVKPFVHIDWVLVHVDLDEHFDHIELVKILQRIDLVVRHVQRLK